MILRIGPGTIVSLNHFFAIVLPLHSLISDLSRFAGDAKGFGRNEGIPGVPRRDAQVRRKEEGRQTPESERVAIYPGVAKALRLAMQSLNVWSSSPELCFIGIPLADEEIGSVVVGAEQPPRFLASNFWKSTSYRNLRSFNSASPSRRLWR